MKIKAVDVYIQSATLPKMEDVGGWKCTDVFNRGTRVGPEGKISCHMTDVFQCRFSVSGADELAHAQVVKLLGGLGERKISWSDVHIIFE